MVLSSKRFTIYSWWFYLICLIFDIWDDYFKIYLWSCFSSRLKLFINFIRASKINRGGDRRGLKQRESMHSIIKIINDGKYIFMRELMRTDNFHWSRPHIPAATKPSSPGWGSQGNTPGLSGYSRKTKLCQETLVICLPNVDCIIPKNVKLQDRWKSVCLHFIPG